MHAPTAIDVVAAMAVAVQSGARTPQSAPLVMVEREARCEGCGRRIGAGTEGRRVAGSLVHVECLHIFAGPGGR
jgi:hypothetical protein